METKKILTKEEVVSFDLWAIYFNFLISLKEAFERELSANLNGEKVHSSLDSKFYEVDGSVKSPSADYPNIEKIYFQVEGKPNFIGIHFRNGRTLHFSLDFYDLIEKDGKKYGKLSSLHAFKTENLFSSEVIAEAVCWIKNGEIASLYI